MAAATHRGSWLATGLIGAIGTALVRTPRSSRELARKIRDLDPDVFNPDLNIRISAQTSIHQMGPDSPFLLGIASLPIDPSVPYHTIVGDRSGGG